MTFNEFKDLLTDHNGFYLRDARDRKKSLYGDCGNLAVADYQYNPLNGIYTVYLVGVIN